MPLRITQNKFSLQFLMLIVPLHLPLTNRVRATNYLETAWIVHHLKPCKATGPDRIQNIIFRHLSLPVLIFVAKIFNRSLALNYLPTQWKEAKIFMIPQPAKGHTYPLNYSPTSQIILLYFCQKIILKRLNFRLRELTIITNETYGFKIGHSTAHGKLLKCYFYTLNADSTRFGPQGYLLNLLLSKSHFTYQT